MALIGKWLYVALALLGAIPAVAFVLGRSDPRVWLAVVCVAVIAASLYFMFSAAESETAPAA